MPVKEELDILMVEEDMSGLLKFFPLLNLLDHNIPASILAAAMRKRSFGDIRVPDVAKVDD